VARREDEFYVRAAREHKIHIFELTCNVPFIMQTYKHPNTNSHEKAGNDVIDVFTCEDMENTPLRSRMQFRMSFTSDVFSSKTPVSIQ